MEKRGRKIEINITDKDIKSSCEECTFLIKGSELCSGGTHSCARSPMVNIRLKSRSLGFPLSFVPEDVNSCSGFMPSNIYSLSDAEVFALDMLYKKYAEYEMQMEGKEYNPSQPTPVPISMNLIRIISKTIFDRSAFENDKDFEEFSDKIKRERERILPIFEALEEKIFQQFYKNKDMLKRQVLANLRERGIEADCGGAENEK